MVTVILVGYCSNNLFAHLIFIGYQATAAAVTDHTKHLDAREAGLLYYICQNSHYMLSCYPRFLRLRIRRDTYCTNKNYFESRVKIPLRKPVTKSQTWRF